MFRKIILTTLVFSIFSALAFSAEQMKDKTVQLRGEKIDGGGYKIFFDKEKKKYIHLHGFMRMYLTDTGTDKVNMPYFRSYWDFVSNEKWSYHSRLDYSTGARYKGATDAEKRGFPSIYFARAYSTYKFNDNLTISMGRMLNYVHKYDVLSSVNYEVDLGANVEYSKGDYSGSAVITYIDQKDRWNETANQPEAYVIGVRNQYTTKINANNRLVFGLGVNGDAGHQAEKFVQVMPDITYEGANDFYIIDQFMWREMTTDKTMGNLENYIEAGWRMGQFYPDIYFKQTKQGTAEMEHQAGLEVWYKPNKNLNFFLAHERKDFNNENKSKRKVEHTFIMQYYF